MPLLFFLRRSIRAAGADCGIITLVIYALRKLIAFVFLGGMFWFIYQDLDNLNKPWFMHALGLITIAFAFFWLLIPMVVVWCRIRRRCAQNKTRYQKWLVEGGVSNLWSRPLKKARLMAVDSGEQAFFHEKGTLYVDLNVLGDNLADRPVGRPSDVAFSGYRRNFHVCQRTHCYFTNKRVVFEGKDLDADIPFGSLAKFTATPGGIAFGRADAASFLFTFQNPLIAADVLRFVKDGMSVRE